MPWLDTRYSRFLKAFELFWNEWASKQDNLKLFFYDSATTEIYTGETLFPTRRSSDLPNLK